MLARGVPLFDLRKEDFLAVIDGMEMDADGMCAPSLADLDGDGDLDLFVGVLNDMFRHGFWYYRNDGDSLAPGQRSASTTNRNFEGRQGPGALTHIMSPAMAAAAAVTGHLTDVRSL